MWVVHGRIAVAAAGACVKIGLLRGEGEKNGGAPCLCAVQPKMADITSC